MQEFIRTGSFAVAAGTLAALAGIYNTHLLGWPGVWVYWVSLIGFGLWIGGAINAQIGPLIAHAPWVMRWLLSSVAVTAPMLGIVTVAQTLIGYPVPASHFPDLTAKVFVITAAITGIRLMQRGNSNIVKALSGRDDAAHHTKQETRPAAAMPAGRGHPALASRLPQKLKGAEIWALSAEDHYVRVHTAAGADLILMRLADAIELMDGVEGLRVHRSWWIAHAGFARFRRRTEGGIIILKDGTEAPVSRRNVTAFESAQWNNQELMQDARC